MNEKPHATSFGTCSCEDTNAISDETDRPCVDPAEWEEGDAVTLSAKKEVEADCCCKK